jgi:thiol peroxidase
MKRETTFGKNNYKLSGKEIKIGEIGPNFTGTTNSMGPFDFYAETKRKIKIISSVPSIDTSICSLQTIRFNEEAGALKDDVIVVTVSADLPFAQKRFCGSEGIENSFIISDYRNMDFGKKYGFLIEDLRILSRGVIVLDRENIVRHIEYVENSRLHPNYERALAVVEKMLYEETLEAVDELLHQ